MVVPQAVTTVAVLELRGARIDVGGSPALDGLSLETTSEHVVVLGAPRALFEAASGVRRAAHGDVLVRGTPAEQALKASRACGAPLDPPMPAAWTAREYVTWSARLAGHPRRAATMRADDAIDRMKMRAVAEVKLGRAAVNARRAVVIAAAIATGADAIFLEDPLVGLPDESARNLARLVTSALEDTAWVVFAGRMPLSSPLALHADEAIVISGSNVRAQGAPGEIAAREHAFMLRVHGEAEAFARLATARGAHVVRASETELTIDLDELGTMDLMAIAEQAGAVIIELSPVARALK